MEHTSATADYGAPREIWMNLAFPHDRPAVEADVRLMEKTRTRLPEAHWLTVAVPPNSTDAVDQQWMVDKLGEVVNACDVVSKGAQHLHLVGPGGISLASSTVSFKATDSALLAIGQRSPFPTPFTTPCLGSQELSQQHTVSISGQLLKRDTCVPVCAVLVARLGGDRIYIYCAGRAICIATAIQYVHGSTFLKPLITEARHSDAQP